MLFPKSILVAGTGNLATRLIAELSKKDDFMVSCWGRNQWHVRQLVSSFGISPYSANAQYDLTIICVSDSAIGQVASELAARSKNMVHCAGSVSIHTLAFEGENYGVMWPVQSFSNVHSVSFEGIPFVYESNNQGFNEVLIHFIERLGGKAVHMIEEDRKKMHLAAIFASNFSNAMYIAAFEWCTINKIDPIILLPLIRETAQRLESNSPINLQTGPAKRNDNVVISEHLTMLNKKPELKELYRVISNFIQQKYSNG